MTPDICIKLYLADAAGTDSEGSEQVPGREASLLPSILLPLKRRTPRDPL